MAPPIASLGPDGILHITVTAWPTRAELTDFRQRIRRSGLLSDDVVLLADLRALGADDRPSWEDLKASLQVPMDATVPRKYALLFRLELRDLFSVIETLAPEPLQVKTFTDEAEARTWLLRR